MRRSCALLFARLFQKYVISGIYRALSEMERAGYVDSRWDAPQAGPARKVFQLTTSGRACLGQWRRTLRAYRNDLDRLLTVL